MSGEDIPEVRARLIFRSGKGKWKRLSITSIRNRPRLGWVDINIEPATLSARKRPTAFEVKIMGLINRRPIMIMPKKANRFHVVLPTKPLIRVR